MQLTLIELGSKHRIVRELGQAPRSFAELVGQGGPSEAVRVAIDLEALLRRGEAYKSGDRYVLTTGECYGQTT